MNNVLKDHTTISDIMGYIVCSPYVNILSIRKRKDFGVYISSVLLLTIICRVNMLYYI